MTDLEAQARNVIAQCGHALTSGYMAGWVCDRCVTAFARRVRAEALRDERIRNAISKFESIVLSPAGAALPESYMAILRDAQRALAAAEEPVP